MSLTIHSFVPVNIYELKKREMKTKHQVHNLIILDESGSMESIKESIIEGLNEIIQTIKGIEKSYPEQQHFISFVTFNGLGYKALHFNEPVAKLKVLNAKNYNPDASTPLYDTMGSSFIRLKKIVEPLKDYNVLVTILTDGEENASHEFSGLAIRNMINELKQKRWTFTYIGADHDVESFAASISVTNTMTFSKNRSSMNAMFEKDKMARANYSEKISKNENVSANFYEEPEGEENKGKDKKA